MMFMMVEVHSSACVHLQSNVSCVASLLFQIIFLHHGLSGIKTVLRRDTRDLEIRVKAGKLLLQMLLHRQGPISLISGENVSE